MSKPSEFMQRYIRRHVSGPIQHRHGGKKMCEQCIRNTPIHAATSCRKSEWSSRLVPEKRIWDNDMTHWKYRKMTTSKHVKVRCTLCFTSTFDILNGCITKCHEYTHDRGPQTRNSIPQYTPAIRTVRSIERPCSTRVNEVQIGC